VESFSLFLTSCCPQHCLLGGFDYSTPCFRSFVFFFRFCCSLKITYLFVSPEFLATFAKFQCLLSNLFSRNALHLSYSPVMHEPVILQLLSYLPLYDCIFYKCHSSSHFSSRILLDLPVSSGTNALIFYGPAALFCEIISPCKCFVS